MLEEPSVFNTKKQKTQTKQRKKEEGKNGLADFQAVYNNAPLNNGGEKIFVLEGNYVNSQIINRPRSTSPWGYITLTMELAATLRV